MEVSILNASLMVKPVLNNGFTASMRSVFKKGYWEIMPDPHFNENIIRMVNEHKPDITFVQTQTPGIFSPEAAREIAQKTFVINFSGDIRQQLESWYYEVGKEIQLSCFTNMRDVRTCRQIGVKSEWLELGVDPLKYRNWEGITVDMDVVAHFNDYGNMFELGPLRHEIVNRLRKHFGDKFAVFGNFPGAKADYNGDQIAESKNYMRSKIAINCSNFVAERYSSDRMLRILASGGPMCLTHSFPAITEMYTPGEHLVVFSDLDDMINKASYYIQHDDERRAIVIAGQKHCVDKYSFLKMCENIKLLYEKYKA